MSSKSYDNTLRKAQKISNELQIPLDLRNLYEDKDEGLTSSEVCGCGLKHGYIARGRGDDGTYISIEYSTAYEAFSPGYYIIVIASGKRNNLEALLPEIQKEIPEAYIKDSKIYIGCMH